jgi:hypothetical protein
LLKNPPLDVFKDLHNLPHEGITPHMWRTNKDVLETKMVKMFGHARGRSGYSFNDVYDDNALDRIKELYPLSMANLLCHFFIILEIMFQ